MKKLNNSPILKVFRTWNTLLGDNTWNLPGISEKTQKRWFDFGEEISALSARAVAMKVFEQSSHKGAEKLRKDLFDAVLAVFPDAPTTKWTAETCGAWFRARVEEEAVATDDEVVPESRVLSDDLIRDLRE